MKTKGIIEAEISEAIVRFEHEYMFFKGSRLPGQWRRMLNAVTLATAAGVLMVYAELQP